MSIDSIISRLGHLWCYDLVLEVLLLVFGLSALVGAVILLIVARRGPQISDHPWCRACGFDLYRRWPDVQRCPECGKSLKSPRAVRHGKRAMRRRPLLISAVLLLLGLITLLPVALLHGRALTSAVDPIAIKPDWLLVLEAKGAADSSAAEALEELNRRLGAGNLSRGSVRTLVQRGLENQVDTAKPWLFQWGGFIETARKRGSVTDEQWEEYLRHIVSCQFKARRRIRQGDRWPLYLTYDEHRNGAAQTYHLVERIKQIRSDGQSWPLDDSFGCSMWSGGTSSRGGTGTTIALPFGAGSYDLHVDMEFYVPDPLIMAAKGSHDPFDLSNAGACWLVSYSAPLEIVEPGESTVALVDDPSLRETIVASVWVWELWVAETLESTTAVDDTQPKTIAGSWTLNCRLACDAGLPIGLAFDVTLRNGDRTWHLGSGSFQPNRNSTWLHGCTASSDDPDFEDFDAQEVDIILTPNVQVAEQSVDLLEIWNGEIVIKDVPVQWQPSDAPHPAPRPRPRSISRP